MAYSVARYGWRPDLPDHRDRRLAAVPPAHVPPRQIDLRPGCPPIYDQSQLGACTAHAILGACEYERIKQGDAPDARLSRLFLYYNERAMEGSVAQDSGAQIRDGIKSVATTGVCLESEWPYLIERFADQPPVDCYFNAKKDRAVQYARVNQDSLSLRACLAEGYPIVFGFTVYESFESDTVAQTGLMPLPGADESAVGGHAVLAVGYDDDRRLFLVRNSWGTAWGQGGYFWMPYDYILNGDLCDDFWSIRLLTA